jgi:hypothetical protein
MTQAWFKHALVGVGNGALPFDGALATLVERAPHDDAAVTFARGVGAYAACRRAAVVFDATAAAPPPPAPDDARALPHDHPWTRALADAFDNGPERVQDEACRRVAQIGAVLPHALLPRALTAGQRNAALRDALALALGARGAWLAALNPDWRYAAGGASDGDDPDRVWQEGSFAQRLALLRAIRASEPARAREMLRAQLPELPAKERHELVAVLGDRLDADDASILEPLLKDRARDVRQTAASLLALLPESAHAQRLAAWLASLVTAKRGLMSTTWRVDAPADADPGWTAATIDATRPQHDALGERAWWLYQLVRLVPLSWWTRHTGMSAAELVAWSGKSDWKGALHRGWLERLRDDDADWIDAMLDAKHGLFKHQRAALLARLPAGERERHWATAIGELAKTGTLADVVVSCALGATLSSAFSRALVAGLPELIGSDAFRNDWGLRGQLVELAAILHPDALRVWRALPRHAEETPSMDTCLHSIERIVALRRLFHSVP